MKIPLSQASWSTCSETIAVLGAIEHQLVLFLQLFLHISNNVCENVSFHQLATQHFALMSLSAALTCCPMKSGTCTQKDWNGIEEGFTWSFLQNLLLYNLAVKQWTKSLSSSTSFVKQPLSSIGCTIPVPSWHHLLGCIEQILGNKQVIAAGFQNLDKIRITAKAQTTKSWATFTYLASYMMYAFWMIPPARQTRLSSFMPEKKHSKKIWHLQECNLHFSNHLKKSEGDKGDKGNNLK